MNLIEEKLKEAKAKGLQGIRFDITKENIIYLEKEGYTQWAADEGEIIVIDINDNKQYVFLIQWFKENYLKVELPKENQTKQKDLIKCHRVHYLKWDITEDLSIRYHFTFQDKKELENRFIIKCHNDKVWNTIRDDVAEAIIKESNLESKEIIGKLENEEYKKIIVKDDTYSNNTLSTIKE